MRRWLYILKKTIQNKKQVFFVKILYKRKKTCLNRNLASEFFLHFLATYQYMHISNIVYNKFLSCIKFKRLIKMLYVLTCVSSWLFFFCEHQKKKVRFSVFCSWELGFSLLLRQSRHKLEVNRVPDQHFRSTVVSRRNPLAKRTVAFQAVASEVLNSAQTMKTLKLQGLETLKCTNYESP